MMEKDVQPVEKSSPRRRPLSRSKLWLFRGMAVLFGLLLLGCFELALRALDWGRPSQYEDPFVGFSALHPLFVLSDDGARYEIPRARQSHFCYDAFDAKKAANEFRIFVLGGSTVFGRPYAKETSFTTWLELSLQAADPSRKWEVINCGGVSYATYRLVPIMQELLARQPDLFIFCEGHNEFLEDRTYAHLKRSHGAAAWTHERVARLRTYTLVRAAMQRMAGRSEVEVLKARPQLGPEADARLDWKDGMAAYHRDAAWQRDVIDHFEFNLYRMVDICRAARVPLLLVDPASNLDWHPFKAEHRSDLSAEDRERFAHLAEAARSEYGRNLQKSIQLLREAIDIDDQHAGAWYDLGKCYLELGLMEQAREALVMAKDLDVCPLRILSPMHAAMLRVARETDTPIVDADALFADRSRGRIPGVEWLVDHVHPSIEGHQLLADAIADKLVEIDMVQPASTWVEDRRRAYREHSDSLDALYYAKGQERLRNEQGWAHGQVTLERPTKSDPPRATAGADAASTTEDAAASSVAQPPRPETGAEP